MAVLPFPVIARADIVIDSFSAASTPNQWPITQNVTGNNLITEPGVAGVIGGARQTNLAGGSFATGSDSLMADLNVGTGLLTYTSTSGADGALSLFYTGFPSGLNRDFTNELGVQIDFADHGLFGPPLDSGGKGASTQVTVVLNDGLIDVSRSEFLHGSGVQSLFFDINLFTNIESFDLLHLNRITVTIDTDFGVDFSLDKISTRSIPAPGALGLLAIMGLAGSRRRRRN